MDETTFMYTKLGASLLEVGKSRLTGHLSFLEGTEFVHVVVVCNIM
jgi:hypothetical protein